jgi:hypothetical protein
MTTCPQDAAHDRAWDIEERQRIWEKRHWKDADVDRDQRLTFDEAGFEHQWPSRGPPSVVQGAFSFPYTLR